MNPMSVFARPWTEFSYVAFDLETSGAYPIGSEIVEFGAVKWQNGKDVDQFQTLLKPTKPMSDFNISIHGITNEMVADAPPMSTQIGQIRAFFEGSILMAHHAPFDLGFVAYDFEKYKITAPENPVLCTSLFSRKVIPESPNHKLQTLIRFLDLEGGQAHRGLDDARACLQLGLKCFARLPENAPLSLAFEKVGKDLSWSRYSILQSGRDDLLMVEKALVNGKDLDFIYQGSSIKGTRRISPLGIVRSPDGDYVQGLCHIDRAAKRFYFEKIKDLQMTL